MARITTSRVAARPPVASPGTLPRGFTLRRSEWTWTSAGSATALTAFDAFIFNGAAHAIVDPDGQHYWVANGGRAAKYRISDGQEVKAFPVTHGPHSIGVSRTTVLVPSGQNSVRVYDKST